MEQVFSDPSIPAFIKALKKSIKVLPYKEPTGVVVFIVEGDKNSIEEAIDEFYKNASVGVLDYIKELKELRSAIYVLRSKCK